MGFERLGVDELHVVFNSKSYAIVAVYACTYCRLSGLVRDLPMMYLVSRYVGS